MKKTLLILSFAAILAAALLVRASSFPQAQAANTYGATLLSVTTSNKTGSSFNVESFSSHTFQIVTYCTNACSNVISGSLDGTSWFTLATNSVSDSSTNGIIMIGYRVSWLRCAFGQTTANGSTNTVLYLGSRQ